MVVKGEGAFFDFSFGTNSGDRGETRDRSAIEPLKRNGDQN